MANVATEALVQPVRTGTGFWRDAFKRMRRNRPAMLGLGLILLFVVAGVLAPLLAPHSPSSGDLSQSLERPSGAHWMGTDLQGRDELSRIIYGARLSLLVAISSVSVGLLTGGLMGAIAGGFGRKMEAVIMRITDVMLAIPGILLAIGIVVWLGRGLPQIILAVAATNAPIFARLLRGSLLAVRESDFVAASRAFGARRTNVLIRHMIPNALTPVIVQATLSMGVAIIDVAGLGFLGLGPPDPGVAEWGTMLTNSAGLIRVAAYLVFFPGVAIVISVIGFNLLGDGLREALDPRLSRAGTRPPRFERATRSDDAAATAQGALLSVRDLVVRFRTRDDVVHAVNGNELVVEEGERLGVVGESGSGKSVTSLAIMRLLPQPAGRVEGGSIAFDGRDLLTLSNREMRELRGHDIAMVFQDPMTSLNPVLTIEEQLVETIRAHRDVRPAAARARAVELLEMVGIPEAASRLRSYPHEFSGGMRQRVMIAMALALEPRVLIADEPTTALDVTIQAQVLDLLRALTAEHKTSLVLITHDLGVVAGVTDRVNVMYAGELVETGRTVDVFTQPTHPYTVGLLHSTPHGDSALPLVPIEGNPPRLTHEPVGCPFTPRCAWRLPVCLTERPALLPAKDEPIVLSGVNATQRRACHNPPTPEEAAAGRPLPREGAVA